MSTTDECLDDAALREVAQHSAAGQPLPAHVESCSKCRARLAALVPTGSLDGLAPTVPASGSALEPNGGHSGPLEMGEMIGPYVVSERLAEGGMGVLYVAMHPGLNRKVALKVIRPNVYGHDQAGGQLRLLREAQAMAQLSHPNVVTVFDAGTAGNKVFLAMELIDGTTLSAWLRQSERTWREKVQAFLEAGRGLAAAHRAGLIHRDFKPENVLVSKDGQVQVTDFGLARADGDVETVSERISTRGLPARAMTLDGAVMGTPGFMAPEQARGERADARSDQFSFFVSLWLGLFGELPHHGTTLDEVARSAQSGTLKPVPARAKVPLRVQRVIARGLRGAPSERYPTLDEALVDLERAIVPLSRRALPWAAAAFALAVIALIAVLAVRAARPPVIAGCDEPTSNLAGVWDASAREAVARSLLAAPGADAHDANAALRALDTYSGAWRALQKTTCAAAAAAPADETLLQLSCLSRERTALRSLVEVLEKADHDIAHAAVKAVGGLTAPSRCRDPHMLALMAKLPADLRQRAQVELLRVKLADAAALSLAGKPKPAIAALEPLLEQARALGFGPLQAEVAFTLAHAEQASGEHAKAETYGTEAEKTAELAGDDLLAARAAAEVGFVVGYSVGRLADGHGWVERARLNLARAGGDRELEAKIDNTEMALAMREGRDEDAVRFADRAWQLDKEVLGEDHPRTLNDLTNLAITYETQCRYDEGLARSMDSIAIMERVLGADAQPLVAPHLTVAGIYARGGQFDEAERHLDRAEQILKQGGLPADNDILVMRSGIRSDQQRDADALALAEAAVPLARNRSGPESTQFAYAIERRAEALESLGRHREALEGFDQAIALIERTAGKDSIALVGALGGSADAWLGLKQPSKAIPLAERALTVVGDHCPDPGIKAVLRFSLARALDGVHRDAPKVKQLAQAAHAELATFKWKKPLLDEVDAWATSRHLELGTAPPPR